MDKTIHFNTVTQMTRRDYKTLVKWTKKKDADKIKFIVAQVDGLDYIVIPYRTLDDLDQWTGICMMSGVHVMRLTVVGVYLDCDLALRITDNLNKIKTSK